jgi:hypothetical protein
VTSRDTRGRCVSVAGELARRGRRVKVLEAELQSAREDLVEFREEHLEYVFSPSSRVGWLDVAVVVRESHPRLRVERC